MRRHGCPRKRAEPGGRLYERCPEYWKQELPQLGGSEGRANHDTSPRLVERVMFAPLIDLRALWGVGPRVAEHTINAIPLHPFPSYEDMRLKGQ